MRPSLDALRPTTMRLLLAVGLAVPLVVGSLFWAPIVDGLAQGHQADAGRPVEATVVSASATPDPTLPPSRVDPPYEVRVEYRYVVDGRTYTGENHVPPGIDDGPVHETTNRQLDARNRVRWYRNHSTTRAYYLPDHPGTSFLVPSRGTPTLPFVLAPFWLGPLAVGFVATAVGAGGLRAGVYYALAVPALFAYWLREGLFPLWIQVTPLAIGIVVAALWYRWLRGRSDAGDDARPAA